MYASLEFTRALEAQKYMMQHQVSIICRNGVLGKSSPCLSQMRLIPVTAAPTVTLASRAAHPTQTLMQVPNGPFKSYGTQRNPRLSLFAVLEYSRIWKAIMLCGSALTESLNLKCLHIFPLHPAHCVKSVGISHHIFFWHRKKLFWVPEVFNFSYSVQASPSGSLVTSMSPVSPELHQGLKTQTL